MKRMIRCILGISCFQCLLFNTLLAEHLSSEIELSPVSEDKFVDVVHHFLQSEPNGIQEPTAIPQVITLDVAVKSQQIFVKSSTKQSGARNYALAVNESEKEDLRYITSTLAHTSLPSLAASKSSLKKAGDRIDHLHPLRFLMVIFTDEEMKANIHAIRSRSWVWSQFYEGLEGSLKEESKKDNIRIEFIVDFANTIGINASAIQSAIQEKRWKEFVNILIDSIPRSGNPSRYDM